MRSNGSKGPLPGSRRVYTEVEIPWRMVAPLLTDAHSKHMSLRSLEHLVKDTLEELCPMLEVAVVHLNPKSAWLIPTVSFGVEHLKPERSEVAGQWFSEMLQDTVAETLEGKAWLVKQSVADAWLDKATMTNAEREVLADACMETMGR